MKWQFQKSSEQRRLSSELYASTRINICRHHGSYLIYKRLPISWTVSSKEQPAAPARLNLRFWKSSLQNQSISSALPTVWSRRFDYYMKLLERTHFQNEVTTNQVRNYTTFARLVAHYSTFYFGRGCHSESNSFLSALKASPDARRKCRLAHTRFIVCGLSAPLEIAGIQSHSA